MASPSGWATRISARLATVLPDRLVGAGIRRVYPRIEPELARIAEFVPRGGTAVDVGAWYGPWTSRLLGRADRVVAVEPTEHLARHLRRAFPAVEVVRAGASERAGSAVLHLPPGGPTIGTSSLEYGDGPGTPVRLVAIDDLGLTDVRFIKLDVEGHELPALRGAAGTIRRDRPNLLIEVEERIQPVEPIVELLAGWGYAGWVLPAREWRPLAGFDLVGQQRATIARIRQSFVRRVLWPHPRYVNSVLFRPAGPG